MRRFNSYAFWHDAFLLLAAGVGAMAMGALFDRAIADNRTIWVGGMDGFAVDWGVDRLDVTRDGKPVLSFGAVAARDWTTVRENAPGQELTLEQTYTVLAEVGPWLSVQEGSFCECGGAHPSAMQRFRAYDLRESQPDHGALADLSKIFARDIVLTALLHNELVASALKATGVESPRTLPDLLRELESKTITVGDCSFFFDNTLLSSFAFDRIEGPNVAVRLALSSAAEVCGGALTQIEVLMPVPDALRAQFDAAKGGMGGGLLMEKAESVTAGRTTTFTFSYKPQ
jgi:hypothetical protein